MHGPQLGIPILPIIARWGLPWILTAGGIAVAALTTKSILPSLPINQQKIGLAALLGGAGVTSYMVSDLVPQEWRAIPYAIAVAGVASAAYFLFSQPEPSPEKAVRFREEAIRPEEQVPRTPGQLLALLSVQIDPNQANTGGLIRSAVSDQEFDFVVRNKGNRPLTFYAGLAVLNVEQKEVFRSQLNEGPYGRLRMTAQPGDSKGRLRSGAFGAFVSGVVTVEIELFESLSATIPFLRSSSIAVRAPVIDIWELFE